MLSIYPHQLKDWASSSTAAVYFEGEFLTGSNQLFVYPVKLPVGARVTQLKVWAMSNDGDGYARLTRVKDGYTYSQATDDLAAVHLNNWPSTQWSLLEDVADGPAPTRIATGYRYYLRVNPVDVRVGTIQIIYTTP